MTLPTDAGSKDRANKASTSTSLPSWREALSRRESPFIFKGSWASRFTLIENARKGGRSLSSQGVSSSYRLGQPGMAEVHFTPYALGSARRGPYGVSALGHTISHSILGPTLKSPQCDHQWRLDSSGSSDELVLDNLSATSVPSSIVSTVATRNTITEIYGFDDLTFPDSGVYLVVSATGSQGDLDNGAGSTVSGGVGDMLIGDDGVGIGGLARKAISPLTVDSKFEIFRVVGVSSTLAGKDTLVLDSGKRFRDYFDIPDTGTFAPIVRAVTLFQPAASRVVKVPGSSTSFALLPPDRSLVDDYQPPLTSWTTEGVFDPWTAYKNIGISDFGDTAHYNNGTVTPLNTSLVEGECRFQGVTGETVDDTDKGVVRFVLRDGDPFSSANVGKLLNITNVDQRTEEGSISNDLQRVLGFWEIVASGTDAGSGADENYYEARRVSQVDPSTGVPHFSSSEGFTLENAVSLEDALWMDFQVHSPVSTLWTESYVNAQTLSDARLSGLADPSWGPSNLKGSDAFKRGSGASDRSIFDTLSTNSGVNGSNTDPGSLLSLGFRVVLFPAKDDGSGGLIPDFDNPISTNHLTLDPSNSEDQYYEVDYASGLVHLSHTPVAGLGCDLIPDAGVLTNTSNPRGEPTFFASCVLASESLRRNNLRVSGSSLNNREGDRCYEDEVSFTGAFGARKGWPLEAGQTITTGTHQTIVLDQAISPAELAPTGFIDLVQGDGDPSGSASTFLGRRQTTWGYSGVTYGPGSTTLTGVFGGGSSTSVQPTFEEPWTAYLRREIEMWNDLEGGHGTTFAQDTQFGSVYTPSKINFKHADLTQELDGSLTVDIRSPETKTHTQLFGDLFSSGILSGGEVTTTFPSANGGTLDFAELVVVVEGVRSVIPAQSVASILGLGTVRTVYVDVSDPYCPRIRIAGNFPLDDGDILLGVIEEDNTNITSYTDLRSLISNLGQNLEVTVGDYTGYRQPVSAHFSTLAAAVAYLKETAHANDGMWKKITIVGPTEEDPATLPIKPEISGLIIEGSQWSTGGTTGAPLEVVWKGSAPALFDLDGCEGWIIRDVNFRYDEDGAGVDATVENRVLFYNSGTECSEMVFENVRLNGPAHGFFLSKTGAGTNGLSKGRFKGCIAEELTDFAIRFESTATVCEDVLIESCTFEVVDATAETALTNHGMIHTSSSNAKHFTVSHCVLTGGDIGVYFDNGGNGFNLTHCRISDTFNAGLVLGTSFCTITHNEIKNVHRNAASASTIQAGFRAGIYQETASDELFIAHNLVTVDTYVDGDYAVFISSNGENNTLQGNVVRGRFQAGSNAQVLNNTVEQGILSLGSNTTAIGNRVSNSSTGNIVVGNDCTVQGNIVASNLTSSGQRSKFFGNHYFGDGPHNTGADCRFVGDTFGDPATPSVDGRVSIVDGCSFTQCIFGQGFQDGGASREGVRITDSYVIFDTSIAFQADDVSIQGCRFFAVNTALTVEFDGENIRFIGNSIGTNGPTFHFNDADTATRQEYVISNNRFEATGGGSGGFYIEGDHCSVTNNIVEGSETISGTPNVAGIVVEGDYNVVSQNNLLYQMYVDGDYNVVSQNIVSGGLVTGTNDNCTVEGNRLGVDGVGSTRLTVAGTAHSITNNHVGGNATLNVSSDSLISSNMISGIVSVDGSQVSFRGNDVGQLVFGLTAGVSSFNINDNRVGSNVSFTVAGTTYMQQGTFSGNTVGGVVVLDGDAGNPGLNNVTVSGNLFESTFSSVYSERCTFTGNRFQGDVVLSNGDTPVIQGNHFSSAAGSAIDLDVTDTNNYIIVGNHISGDLTVDGGAGAVNTGVIVANYVGSIADGLVQPTNNQITHANKVDNGGNVYLASPGTSSVNSDNVED